MKLRLTGLSRRSITAIAAVAGVASLAIGAHAALNKRALEPARASDTAAAAMVQKDSPRLALVIGNGHYPDAAQPLTQPINDARALSAALRRQGFDVDMVEDATRDDIVHAVDRLKARARKDGVVMLFFGGYGIQSGRESYMIPVDAKIWSEADVRRSGVSVESVLDAMNDSGVRTKLAVIDASRRNPYERRFRAYSHGLAAIAAPANALVLSSTAPDQVADDSDGQNSLLVGELLGSMTSPGGSVEAAFNKARMAVIKATEGAQVPTVTSSLTDEVPLSPVADATPSPGG